MSIQLYITPKSIDESVTELANLNGTGMITVASGAIPL